MAGSVQYPGGFNEEEGLSGVVVSPGPTAIPVFIGDFGTAFEGVAKAHSWPEFSKAAGEATASGVTGTMLRGYFENGGGRTYLANTAGKTVQQALATVKATLDDVTIVVPLGLWDRGAEAAGETARAVTAYAAGHQAMAVLHADRDHDVRQARDAARAFNLDADQSAHAAFYHPWLIPSGDGTQPVPPVGAVAGLWAKVDAEKGVWKAAANVTVSGARLSRKVTDEEQSEAPQVNCLREFAGQGVLVWGARTLNESSVDWKHIPVRRLADTVERDLRRTLRSVEFEPNTQPTWGKVRAAADGYLRDIWKQGGLKGGTSDGAYFVQIGQGVTMTEEDVKAGRIVLKVGIAALRPAEFIKVTLTGTMAQV